MSRAKRLSFVALTTSAALLLAACGGDNGATDGDDEQLKVVSTFSIIDDIAQEVGGDAVETHSVVPLGVDPHEYAPLPADVEASTDADVLLWNGLNLEVGDGWFESLADTAGKDLESEEVVEVSVGVDPLYLTDDDGGEDEVNPHAFLSPKVGMIYTENIRDGLISADPDNEDLYTENAEDYLAELAEIDDTYTELIADIPSEDRILVTSEQAFQYMVEDYDLDAGYIWAIDTDEQGTPDQINDLIALVRDRDVPALFVEANVDERPMETVSSETGAPIGGVVHSDDLGEDGEAGGTYLGALRTNIEVIHAGLTEDTKS